MRARGRKRIRYSRPKPNQRGLTLLKLSKNKKNLEKLLESQENIKHRMMVKGENPMGFEEMKQLQLEHAQQGYLNTLKELARLKEDFARVLAKMYPPKG